MADIAVIMGSKSDLETVKECLNVLEQFEVSYDCLVISAHRTPEAMIEFGKSAREKGYKVIIAAAGGAAHLPGMTSSVTTLPVIGIPVKSSILNGVDSLLSIVQMPRGIGVLTTAIGGAGAYNAGLMAVEILSIARPELVEKLDAFKKKQTDAVLEDRVIKCF